MNFWLQVQSARHDEYVSNLYRATAKLNQEPFHKREDAKQVLAIHLDTCILHLEQAVELVRKPS